MAQKLLFSARFSVFALLALLVLALAPVRAQQAANLTAECVSEYDSAVDYFPEKAEIEYATGFSVEYYPNYKVVTVSRPWGGAQADDALQYVLVQCGTPVPEGFDGAQVIEVPVRHIISMSTNYLPYIVEFDLLDRLVGVDNASALYTNYEEIMALVQAGDLVNVGETGPQVNVEVVLNAEPDLVMAYGSGLPEYDVHPVLLEAGIPLALNGDFAETHPLGQAEWGKFLALFSNVEAAATTFFDEEVARYEELAALTTEISDDERPLVLSGSYSSFGDSWYVPGGDSFAAIFIHDAGAQRVLADDPSLAGVTGGVPLDFETVYNAGLEADVWLPGAFAIVTLDDLLTQDERYADFAAVQSGQVYNNDARVNANGGNAYYEEGIAHPSLILADLIAIFHPELLPDHEFALFRQLEPATP